MRKRRVVLAPEAQAYLASISGWLSDEASAAIARRYLARIKKRLASLAHASERGTVRDDITKGLRVIGRPGDRAACSIWRPGLAGSPDQQ